MTMKFLSLVTAKSVSTQNLLGDADGGDIRQNALGAYALGSVPLAGGLPRKKHHLSVLRAERCQVEVKTCETERADIEW